MGLERARKGYLITSGDNFEIHKILYLFLSDLGSLPSSPRRYARDQEVCLSLSLRLLAGYETVLSRQILLRRAIL